MLCLRVDLIIAMESGFVFFPSLFFWHIFVMEKFVVQIKPKHTAVFLFWGLHKDLLSKGCTKDIKGYLPARHH